jgi:ribosome-associated heat shock protein Hsp15
MTNASDSKWSRIDKWLFCARLCRTRAVAQETVEVGKFRLNGTRVQKPGHAVRPADVLTLTLDGTVRVVTVQALPNGGRPQPSLSRCICNRRIENHSQLNAATRPLPDRASALKQAPFVRLPEPCP